MYRIIRASKDTYITNRVIDGVRVTDANVGQAATLDLFKLYNETVLSSSTEVIELSRLLIKFDLDPLRALTGSVLDFSHPSFRAYLKLHDVVGGNAVPNDFSLIVHPLSRSFDEGLGRDIATFQDIGACNFLTASINSGTPVLWVQSGAAASGSLGSSGLDIIETGDLGIGSQSIARPVSFVTGQEDLVVDITQIVSATLAQQIPDHGFRIAFSGSFETNNRTLFVKRFASRHNNNTRIRPKIEILFDDSIVDHTSNFYFDTRGSIFLSNSVRGATTNIVSGSSQTPITGSNSILLRLTSGSFSQTVTGSQHSRGTLTTTGLYSASFVVSSYETLLLDEIRLAHSATFDAVWSSIDGTVGYHSGTLVIKAPDRSNVVGSQAEITLSITNLKSVYKQDEVPIIRVFAHDNAAVFTPRRLPKAGSSKIFDRMYYQVRDFNSGDILIPFHETATRLSTDSTGMYFTFYPEDLDVGRVYEFEFKTVDLGIERVFEKLNYKFRVEA